MVDEAIAVALDARLIKGKSRPVPDVVAPVEGPTEPRLIAIESRDLRENGALSGVILESG